MARVPKWFFKGRDKVFECTITLTVRARNEEDAKAIIDTLLLDGPESPFMLLLLDSKEYECEEVIK